MSDVETIQRAIHRSCGSPRLVVDNVFVLSSPFESDVVSVTEAGYYTEYEIKLSVSDYSADFRKRFWRGVNKHEFYASKDATARGWGKRPVPKPKYFWFVTPQGLLDNVEIPPHCGHLEMGDRYLTVRKAAPSLKKPTKLDQKAVYNLALKIAHKYHVLRIANDPGTD